MRAFRAFLDRLLNIGPQPARARALPEGMRRIHLFAGDFGTEAAARAYVLGPVSGEGAIPDAPAPMTVDLPDAYIDTAFLQMAWGFAREALLARHFRGEALLDAGHLTTGADTVVVLAEEGLGGFPFLLHDTPMLRYLGAFEVGA